MKVYSIKLSGETTILMDLLKLQREIVNQTSIEVFNKKPKLSIKHVHDLMYYPLKEMFPSANSQLLIKCEQEVMSHYKAAKSNKHTIQNPIKKKNLCLRLDKRIYKFKTNGIIITTLEGRKTFEFSPYNLLQTKLILLTPRDPLIFERDGEIWLQIPFDEPKPQLDKTLILGVDLGVKRAAVTSDGVALKDNKYLKEKRKLRYLRRQLQSKGTKSARKHLAKLRHKESNKTKNQTHKIINEILKTNANVIVIEDLTKIKSKNKGKRLNNRLSQAPFYLIKQYLTYKAPYKGKCVVTVNPAYTSQDDCRGLDRGIRRGCRYYAKDGKVLDADWNAAINIGLRHSKQAKLPITFDEPLDGKLNFIWQADIERPTVSG